ncbi:MAG: hypothetical protein ACOY5C_11485 [Pseudomonadota bacterium]|uniref:DUF5789 family protein n=1 Tax=Thermithiobacillus tepidarius TaxID=929 RepID=UPI0003FE6FD5|nr:hypothetical protein [Thermithiobacillus tepidarius]
MANLEHQESTTPVPGPIRGSIYGVKALSEALAGLTFPVEKGRLLAVAGERELEYRPGERVPLRELIEESEQAHYESMAQVVTVVSEALERRGITDMDAQKGTIHN